ncbi:cytidylyltransferase domain-containing protein [Synechococcus sp. MIT S9504]|uniref:acylneuraminate cytidylyltransferase family protein n=1 Tax=Synechococcus sp. MIT S9504 TaxID=1801628 RepID=UPI0007BB309F|nr:hypothetical protein [Synechococcus sp. MIT S9504]KZR82815.1 N-acylneuraminate cytidylyltransferase [Synechococcus sp. MIT S9504]
MSDICIIPARAGSQRVKDKNFRKFSKNGCSLLDTKIKHAKACFDSNSIIVSSDSKLAKEAAKRYGVCFHERSIHYSNSVTSWPSVIINILSDLSISKDSTVTWALPTSPFFKDYKACLHKFHSCYTNQTHDSLVAVYKHQTFFLNEYGSPENFSPGHWHPYSQQLKPKYEICGACFIAKMSDMIKWNYWYGTKPYLFQVTKCQSIDIDTQDDFNFAKSIESL